MWDVFALPFMKLALIASALTGAACGYLSVYVVLKRLVFIAIALAQIASAAVALSLFTGFNPTLSALVAVLAGALLFSWTGLGRVLPRENAIGAAYALASAAGVLLIAKSAQGESHMLNLMYGSVLTVETYELWIMGGVVLVAAVLFLRYEKELLFTSFDAEMARTLGVRTRLWESLFYLTLGLVIALAIRLGGMMLVFALLVLPGYAVLLARCRIRQAFLWAPILAVATSAAGLYCSFMWDLPTSAVTIAGLGLVVSAGALLGGRAVHRARAQPLLTEGAPAPYTEA